MSNARKIGLDVRRCSPGTESGKKKVAFFLTDSGLRLPFKVPQDKYFAAYGNEWRLGVFPTRFLPKLLANTALITVTYR